MAKHERLGLTAVRTEGAILPASILQRIHREDPGLDGLKPEQYDLTGDRLREAASRAWTALQGPWMNFKAERAKLAPSEAGTTITRNRWLYPILRELHFGPLEPLRESLKYDEKEFPVSHKFGHSPLHLIGCNLALDKRTPGAVGAAKMSPHGLLQSCLNSTKENLWGFVSNGLLWRVLRDDNSLSRQSMVEFDLEAIFEGQLYDEFLLFFLVCHRSRIQSDQPEQCWLERWSQAAGEDGKRALNTLRDGVQKSIEALGQGFLKHPANHELRTRIRNGELDKQDYYRQLLRMVYRLLFLFVAEDRGLLLDPKAKDTAKALFNEHFSTQRLRLLAERMRGSSRHHDLFDPLKMVLSKLGEPAGCPELALPALGGFLFAESTAPDLDSSEIANADLLEAVRFLAVTREGGRLARVDYKNLGTEELGSVYESLLELHPDLASDGTWFELKSASGNERKTSGSYYTPDSLIQCLLDTALDPVVNEAVKKAGTDPEERARAILDLRVIDPAVGSGHFLIAASHRLAKRLAQVRTGEEAPSPDAARHAIRDVIGRCLYGIDLNPMAAELCKVSLWIEALEPGQPLGFLDHHVVVGNSLLGTTPELIEAGIPDAAYDPLVGDDRAYCLQLKKRNKAEREGQGNLFEADAGGGDNLLKTWRELESLPDDTLDGIQRKELAFQRVEAAAAMKKLLADAWCAAFFQAKTSNALVITTSSLRKLSKGIISEEISLSGLVPRSLRGGALIEGKESDVLNRFQFIHQHVAFPDVFAKGGFDVVLGNPPWERVKLQEIEFFSTRNKSIATARNAAARKKLISALPIADPELWHEWTDASHDAQAQSHFARNSGRYPLCGRGDINTYALFAEHNWRSLNKTGRAGFIVPSGIATDDTTKDYFHEILRSGALISLWEFENVGFFSAGKGHMLRFALTTLSAPASIILPADFFFQGTTINELADPERHFNLTADDIATLNPNSGTCPIFKTKRDASITFGLYAKAPVLWREASPTRNPFGIRFLRMFDMANDSNLFRTRSELISGGWELVGNRFSQASTKMLPLYEAKMAYMYNHRSGSYEGAPSGERPHRLPVPDPEILADPQYQVEPFYWVKEHEVQSRLEGLWDREWLLGWRDVTDARASARTVVAMLIPIAAVGHTTPLMLPSCEPRITACLYGVLSSFVLDFAARQKIGGLHLTYGYLKQLPVLTSDSFMVAAKWNSAELVRDWIVARVLELTYSSWDMKAFACDCGDDGPPYVWDPARRFLIQCELDAALFHLYAVTRDDADYILETFPVVRRNDERVYGEFRTKRLILEVYDSITESVASGLPYQSSLPPAKRVENPCSHTKPPAS